MSEQSRKSDRLAVVVLNWNNAERTAVTTQALANWHSLQPEILIVDNASSAIDRSRLSALSDIAHTVWLPTNLGYAGGNNVGISKALELGHELILLLNNDATLEEDAARRMIQTMAEHPHLGILGPVIVEITPRGQTATAGGRSVALFPNTRRPLRADYHAQGLLSTVYVPGTVALIRASVFHRIGYLDEAFFFSGEMADFCRRARRGGFECAVLTASRAFHRKQPASPEISALHVYYTLRNRFLYIRKGGLAVGVLRAYWAGIAIAMLVGAMARRNHALQKAVRLALRDGWREIWGNRNDAFLSESQRDHS